MRISKSRCGNKDRLRPMREETTSIWINFIKQIFFQKFAYAKQNALVTTKLNGVEPSVDTFKSGDWLLTAETFLIVYPNGENTKNVYKFVEWCYNNDQYADQLDYVPLSDKKKNDVRKLWK